MIQDGVTIAIPNWNHELLLPRSISAALRAVAILGAQAVAGEVLVIDDASRDGSIPMLRQLEALYFKQGLRTIAHAANQGLAAARNQALAQARYRYVVYMDADNELVPENIPHFLKALRATGAAAVYGNLLVRHLGLNTAHQVLSNETFHRSMFEANHIDAFAMFDRIQVADGGGYDASCPAHEDYEQWLHLAAQGRKVVFVPMVFGYYYVLPNSMLETAYKEASSHPVMKRIRRMYNQVDARKHLAVNTERLRYHPEFGYL